MFIAKMGIEVTTDAVLAVESVLGYWYGFLLMVVLGRVRKDDSGKPRYHLR